MFVTKMKETTYFSAANMDRESQMFGCWWVGGWVDVTVMKNNTEAASIGVQTEPECNQMGVIKFE